MLEWTANKLGSCRCPVRCRRWGGLCSVTQILWKFSALFADGILLRARFFLAQCRCSCRLRISSWLDWPGSSEFCRSRTRHQSRSCPGMVLKLGWFRIPVLPQRWCQWHCRLGFLLFSLGWGFYCAWHGGWLFSIWRTGEGCSLLHTSGSLEFDGSCGCRDLSLSSWSQFSSICRMSVRDLSHNWAVTDENRWCLVFSVQILRILQCLSCRLWVA